MPEYDAFGNPVTERAPVSIPGPPPPPAPALPPATQRDAATQAWVALVCSIGGVVFVPIVMSIVGIVLGRRARRLLGDRSPRGAATAAIWIGWLTVAFWVLGIVLLTVLLATIDWHATDF